MTLLRLVHLVPILTTVVGTIFAAELYRHWQRKPAATYLLWWFLGVVTYVAGTAAESLELTHVSVSEGRLTGAVFEWRWVRRFSPFTPHSA